jgi:hypothetical protein
MMVRAKVMLVPSLTSPPRQRFPLRQTLWTSSSQVYALHTWYFNIELYDVQMCTLGAFYSSCSTPRMPFADVRLAP